MAATAEHFTADDEIQILDSIGNWLDKEVRPVVKHFDHEDEYPEDLVAQMQDIQREDLESEFGTRPIERFQLFLLASLAALVLAELMPRRVSSTSPRDRLGAAID